MSKETYSIPTNPTDRFNFQRDGINLITLNATAWTVPAAKVTAVVAKRTTFEQKYAIASNPATQNPGATIARDQAWDSLEIDLIDIYNHHLLNNAAISAADKEALHIHLIEGNTHGVSPAPTSTPIVTLATEETSMLRIVYADSNTPAKHSKPDNVAFCELVCKIGDPAPASIAECTVRYNIARSHEGIPFQPDQRGKMIYVYPRWVNKNGKTGPWGNRVSGIIP